jgi:alanine racemase
VSRPVRALIDLEALRHNLSQARVAAPRSRVMAIVKADGYGHGLLRVARALADADAFGVASIEEALQLREAGIASPVLLLEGCFFPEEIPLAARYHIQCVVHRPEQIEWLERGAGERPLAVWRRLRESPRVSGPVPVMTHLACADEPSAPGTAEQVQVFRRITEGCDAPTSIANSAALLAWPETHGDWVRPGILLYGVSPFPQGRGADHGLRPAMQLTTRLIAVNRCPRGAAVGYGATFVCPEHMPIGVAAIGYGDGYPRHVPQGTPVLVNGRPAPLVGRVSMDMITVDLRSQPEARAGDPVLLWGAQLPVEDVARAAGTIAYELLCGVAPRVAKEVRGGEG